jgi:hypothetical protein
MHEDPNERRARKVAAWAATGGIVGFTGQAIRAQGAPGYQTGLGSLLWPSSRQALRAAPPAIRWASVATIAATTAATAPLFGPRNVAAMTGDRLCRTFPELCRGGRRRS